MCTERGWTAYQHEVKDILDGRQSQFRRVMKVQPIITPTGRVAVWLAQYDVPDFGEPEGEFRVRANRHCPYGVPGDRLWVREKCRATRPFTGDFDYDMTTERIHYYADDVPKYRDQDEWIEAKDMPRKASRINLEVTDIRVERVQEIGWMWVVTFKRIG